MFDWLINILEFILAAVCIVLAPFFIMSVFWYLYFLIVKKMKPKQAQYHQKVKMRGFFRRLLIDFPKQFILDRINCDPDEFNMYGFHLFVGEQGSGKTVSVAEFLGRIKKEYPLCQIATNFEYKYQDSAITHWSDLIFHNNGVYGQADVIDEVQNWFSSNQSKDFPPEMIQEITQQRKQRKILIGTTQRFERMAKPLREQVNYIYFPMTLFGCLTIVRVCKPTMDSDAQIKKMKACKHYFFIHNEEIRNSFDTYKKIEKQAKDGFHVESRGDGSVVVNNVIERSKRKK